MSAHNLHSPFPWSQHVDSQGNPSTLIVSAADEGRGIVACLGPQVAADANAALIVKAVNEYASLKSRADAVVELVWIADLLKKFDAREGLSPTALGFLQDKAIQATSNFTAPEQADNKEAKP